MKRLLLIVTVVLLGCGDTKTPSAQNSNENGVPQYSEVQTGGVKMIQVDGKYNVWTKKIGDGAIKVLLLHGGPAATHNYFECFEDFLPKAGIQFYYYDQLGCGNSDIPTDTSLWNLPRFVEEVEQVRKGLGLDNFYLYGHSWGSLLSMEYLAKYQDHVKGAVLSNMTAGIKSYLDYTAKLKQEIFTPKEIRTFDSLDRLQLQSSPQYQALIMERLYPRVMCQLDPWPEPIVRAFGKLNASIYIQMQGTDEFHVTGNLRNWEFWDRLPEIKVPTLVIGGMKDEMNPEDMKREGNLIPNSRTYLCPNGSHMSMYDDQQNYFNSLIGFLKEVEGGKFNADPK